MIPLCIYRTSYGVYYDAGSFLSTRRVANDNDRCWAAAKDSDRTTRERERVEIWHTAVSSLFGLLVSYRIIPSSG